MKEKIAYPLCWPATEPRTRADDRRSSTFKDRTFWSSREELLSEIARLGGDDVILSTNIPLRASGEPYVDYQKRRISDPGVAVYFRWHGQQRCLACDRWASIEENVRALYLSIQAMRGLERWGASRILERAFMGFTALPAPEQFWDVLEVPPEASLAECEASYRERIRHAHPDRGGSDGKAARLNWAIAEARRLKRGAGA